MATRRVSTKNGIGENEIVRHLSTEGLCVMDFDILYLKQKIKCKLSHFRSRIIKTISRREIERYYYYCFGNLKPLWLYFIFNPKRSNYCDCSFLPMFIYQLILIF